MRKRFSLLSTTGRINAYFTELEDHLSQDAAARKKTPVLDSVQKSEEKTSLPTANTVKATEDPAFWCVRSYRSGSNIPSQIMGAFQGVHVCTSLLDLE